MSHSVSLHSDVETAAATPAGRRSTPPARGRRARLSAQSLLHLQKTLFRLWPVRAAVGLVFLARGSVLLLSDTYRGVRDFCWVRQASRVGVLRRLADVVLNRVIAQARTGENPLVRAFLTSRARIECHERFLDRPDQVDYVLRDVIVLKHPRPNEKGVLLLKYTTKFELFVSLFDLDRIMRDYRLVLEPCWAGYCDPGILMFLSPTHPVVVQCPEADDFQYIEGLHSNLVPVVFGASDWVDPELFSPGLEQPARDYDLVMVANWGRHKNHRRLFHALPHVTRRPLSVLLLGFDMEGRTWHDIEREMQEVDLTGVTVEIKESLPAHEVAAYLRRSKVFLLLSEKEGSNKAIVEAFFCDVPAIVYERFVGGATSKINPQTGILSTFEELPRAIEYMLDTRHQFTPRAWADAHSGSRSATRQLNATLRRIAESTGEAWTVDAVEKVNRPNLAYKLDEAIPRAHQAGALIHRYLRPDAAIRTAAPPHAAAAQ